MHGTMSTLLWIILIPLIIYLVYKYSTRNFEYWKNQGVPFTKPSPIFGNLYEVLTLQCSVGNLIYEVYKSMETKYIGMFMFNQPMLLIRDIHLIKSVLNTDFDHFEDRNVVAPDTDDISKNILFVLKNPAWKNLRNRLTPIFTSTKLRSMLPLIVEVSKDLKGYIRSEVVAQKAIEVREMNMKYTTDVISSCAFGINTYALQNKDAPFTIAARRMFDNNILRSVAMLASFISPFLVRILKFKFVEPVAGNFMRDVFWKHMEERQTTKTSRGDVLDMLIELQSTENLEFLDKNVILAQAVQFFFAGFETSGSSISFTLYCFATNLDVQHKLKMEIRSVLEKYGNITYEALQDMKYLDCVVNESLRMYPVFPFLDRRCNKTYQIPETNVVLEEGTPVYISLLGLHFDPQYFPNPYKFDPDRFKEENKSIHHNSVYMPFGSGPRNCIGLRFALMTVKVAIIQILSEFDVDVCNSEPLKLETKSLLLEPYDGKMYLRFGSSSW